jgi:ubiquilin
MGAPPSEEQMAELLSNPMVAQTMNEALNNPEFIDYMIRSNPMLAGMPNAREMLQSPYFRNMMTNPEAIRMAARMRRLIHGDGASAFPAPGATDNTPADAPRSEGSAATGNSQAQGASPANPLAALLGLGPLGMGGPLGGGGAASGAAAPAGQTAAASGGAGSAGASANTQAGGANPPVNPFSALFGGLGQTGQAANASNPFGLPPISPEALQQFAQMWGQALPSNPSNPPAPADDRPPEERYAEQLRQLNDMGFFDFERNITALRRSGGSVQGAVEYLLSGQ